VGGAAIGNFFGWMAAINRDSIRYRYSKSDSPPGPWLVSRVGVGEFFHRRDPGRRG
jgi:hypothetical protein